MSSYRPGLSQFFEPANLRVSVDDSGYFYGPNLSEIQKSAKYPEYLGATKPAEVGKYRQFTNPKHYVNDRGHFASKDFANLFPKGESAYEKFDLSPDLGTEIVDRSIQLSQLTGPAKDDLALYLETRGLVVFRNQDFRDQGPQFAKEFGEYYGPLHVHPVSYSAEDYPELFTTFRNSSSDDSRYTETFKDTTKGISWHSDVSFEKYPASFSFFVALEAPPSGGDTVFIDLREAYRRLSPSLQAFLETLTVVHSNVYQNKYAELRGQPKRVSGDLYTKHPLVRVHPVTGEKSLYFSQEFIQRIDGVKREESDFILNFLVDHALNNPEFQVRASHQGTDSKAVIAWDNRFLVHTATLDFLRQATGHRHHYRITVLGERPYNDVIGDGDGNSPKENAALQQESGTAQTYEEARQQLENLEVN
ncbi:alpha-ketoglutarate-dependent sulfonate dioxygenase [Diutina catenulata]